MSTHHFRWISTLSERSTHNECVLRKGDDLHADTADLTNSGVEQLQPTVKQSNFTTIEGKGTTPLQRTTTAVKLKFLLYAVKLIDLPNEFGLLREDGLII